MKILVLVLCLLAAACNPIPSHYDCQMPQFELPHGAVVAESFSTHGYFSEHCPVAIPKRFTVTDPSKRAELMVHVDGEWLRLAARSDNGSMQLSGSKLRGHDARVDELQSNELSVVAAGKVGTATAEFRLPFKLLKCTCAAYDAL